MSNPVVCGHTHCPTTRPLRCQRSGGFGPLRCLQPGLRKHTSGSTTTMPDGSARCDGDVSSSAAAPFPRGLSMTWPLRCQRRCGSGSSTNLRSSSAASLGLARHRSRSDGISRFTGTSIRCWGTSFPSVVHTERVEVRERDSILESDVSPQIMAFERVNRECSFITCIAISNRLFEHRPVV